MSEIKVIYWSQSGNTMSMANAVAEGIKEAGKEAAVLEVSAVTAADLNDETVFALGCPAMGFMPRYSLPYLKIRDNL